ncbi:MAG TPA: TerB family tellurite resistance protein [Alphaproteobacteria bacterium]|nr:TerB family tellurite resistance protein [Alphaproteobacteria bacterium]
MSLWEKLAGGAAEALAGGPLGALVGAFAGQGADRPARIPTQADERVPRAKQGAFLIGIIALSAKMAKADGVVTPDEEAAFRDIIKVPPGELKRVLSAFNLARQSVNGFDSYARQLARLFKDNPRVLEDLLDGLFHIARADGLMHENEMIYLEEVARIFGFTEAEFAPIKARHSFAPESTPYLVLGVKPESSDEEIKSAYRRLVRENHPDAMMARGVPEEFVHLANDKLAAINIAFETIERARGLT